MLSRFSLASQQLRPIHAGSAGSRSLTMRRSPAGSVLQTIALPHGYQAVTVSQGVISDAAELVPTAKKQMSVRSPFNEHLDIRLAQPLRPGVAPHATLTDAAGKTCYRGLAEWQGGGRYRLAVPSHLAAGAYSLAFANAAVLCLKQ